MRRDQWLNLLLLLPGVFILNVVCAVCIRSWPELFVDRGAHVWLIAIQIISFGGYLLYVVRFYLNLASLIAAAHCEWDNATNDRDPS